MSTTTNFERLLEIVGEILVHLFIPASSPQRPPPCGNGGKTRTSIDTQLVWPGGLKRGRWQWDVPDGDLKQRLGAFVASLYHIERIYLDCQATLPVLLPEEPGEMFWDVPI